MKQKLSILVLLIFITEFLFSWEAQFFTSSSANVPEGWYVLENKIDKVTFSDPADSAYFQIKKYPGGTFSTSLEIYQYVSNELGSRGEGESFTFDTMESYFSSISFISGGYRYRGYLVTIEGEAEDFVLFAFSYADSFTSYNDFLLSAIDSFSLNESGLRNPGPVSQFYYPWPGRDKTINYIEIGEKAIPISFDKNEIDAAKVLIEREVRILIQYSDSELADSAWTRYYRLIYRDNYNRIRRVARIISSEISEDFGGLDSLEKSSVLLSWIQTFKYLRTGTLSDFMSPVDTLFSESGDCDSRALLYVILLEYY
ncbi:MAG: hypothetical protein L3J12_09775, partial [Spirochaetales bacterium]|nr:hypothetical protein [Spirochaetales bacterium]